MRRHTKMILMGTLATLVLFGLIAWAIVRLTEALEPMVDGMMDRFDHVIEYERDCP